eukprot:Pgem_evm1s1654
MEMVQKAGKTTPYKKLQDLKETLEKTFQKMETFKEGKGYKFTYNPVTDSEQKKLRQLMRNGYSSEEIYGACIMKQWKTPKGSVVTTLDLTVTDDIRQLSKEFKTMTNNAKNLAEVKIKVPTAYGTKKYKGTYKFECFSQYSLLDIKKMDSNYKQYLVLLQAHDSGAWEKLTIEEKVQSIQ